MLCRRAALLLVVACGICMSAGAANTDPSSLRSYIAKNQRRQAYGVYLKEHKFGWAIDELKLVQFDGKEVAANIFEIHGNFGAGGETARFEERSVIYFDLAGDGQILRGEERTVEDGNEIIRTAVREGDGMVITTRSPGGETTRRIPVPQETLRLMRELEAWLSNRPKRGATFESYSTAWNEDTVDTKEVFRYRGKKKLVWGGAKTDVHLVDVNIDGMIVAFEVLGDGTPLKGMMGGLFELRAEEEPLAKTPGTGPIDMMEASAIKVDKDLGDPEKIASLTLRISGVSNFTLTPSHRQRVRSRFWKSATIELLPDRRTDRPMPLTPADRAQYLKPTPAIQSDQEPLRSRARQIVEREEDVLKQATRLAEWTFSNIRQTMASNASSALDVLNNRAGDCTEVTMLFIALSRAVGIPAREVGGVMYVNEGQPLFGWHAWAEIHDGHQWVSIDPTWNQVYVDATHIKLSEDTNDWSWVNLLGKMRISVVKHTVKR